MAKHRGRPARTVHWFTVAGRAGSDAAACSSWAIPAKSAASVEAVSGGASIARPPLMVLCTLSPAKSLCMSPAEGGSVASGVAGVGASLDSSPAATRASIWCSAEPSSASGTSATRSGPRGRAATTTRSIRERKLPDRSKATSSVVPSKSPVKKACFVPTRSEILDSMPGSLTNL